MSGVRLEAKVHLVTGALKCRTKYCEMRAKLWFRCFRYYFRTARFQLFGLTEDEKELGVCMVDIGGGTTDIAVFREGAIRHTAVIPIAGDQVTNDIAVALRTPTQSAEDIKLKHACALTDMANTKN